MQQALYRKYRPEKLTELVGQEEAVSLISKQIEKDSLGHAYLFSGPRGVGKTSLARIIATQLGCDPVFDITEIDAASNNKVDDIRDMNESVNFIASSPGKKRVYILDEVHMLSNAASNAFLKTLEEPPEHIIFILATTEIKKIPNTIISRCHKLFFLPVDKMSLASSISKIVWIEKGNITNKALLHILNCSEGSLRDAINLVDMLMINDSSITESNCSFLSTHIPYSVSNLFFSHLVSGNIFSTLQISLYIQNKKWLEDSLLTQIQKMLENEIVNSSSSSLKSQHLISLWQLLSKYHSYNSCSTSIFSSFLFELTNVVSKFSTSKNSNTFFNKKKVPSFIKIDDIYIC